MEDVLSAIGRRSSLQEACECAQLAMAALLCPSDPVRILSSGGGYSCTCDAKRQSPLQVLNMRHSDGEEPSFFLVDEGGEEIVTEEIPEEGGGFPTACY